MGQQSSSFHTLTKVKRPSTNDLARHAIPAPVTTVAAPPPETRTPTYVVPENKVLVNGKKTIGNARKHLRPVSQDLSRFHPDYAEVFQTEAGENEESPKSSMRRSASMPGLEREDASSETKPRVNGHVRALSSITPGHAQSRSDENLLAESSGADSWGDIHRSHSLDAGMTTAVYPSRHARQTSMVSRMSLQDSVILEDPREHLYNIARKEPFSNLTPSTTSLPVKSTFDMDYSFNLTYAQLAEHRRQKRSVELEERTGRKLEELGAHISAASNVPKSPFDRNNLGAGPVTHSLSTGSSETGVSKSKKKKAPPPPPTTPFRYSPTNEPPADYDMRGSSTQLNHPPQLSASQSKPKRSNSSVSGKPKPPAPQPFPKRHSLTPPQATPAVEDKPVPSSLSSLFSRPKSTQQTTKNMPPGLDWLQRSKEDAKKQLETLKRLEETLRKVEADSEDTSNLELSNQNQKNQDIDLNKESELAACVESEKENKLPAPPSMNIDSTMNGAQRSPVKAMNSLLQHDIVLAAQARAAKIMKPKSPAVLEKPKDPSEIFQEELAKAALAREERRKSIAASTEKYRDIEENEPRDSDRVLLFESRLLRVSKSSPKKIDPSPVSESSATFTKMAEEPKVSGEDNKEDSEEDMDELKIAESVDMSKRPSVQYEAMSISSSGTSHRMLGPDWIPELDLDSDDDIMDEKLHTSSKSAPTEGFKSSILPSKLHELKSDGNKEKKKTKALSASVSNIDSAPPADDKNKFGSVRKFKQGVKNAFGSISKASGKLFKKPKLKDKDKADSLADIFPRSEDGKLREFLKDQNWVLTGSRSNSLRHYHVDVEEDESHESWESERNDVGDIDFASGIDRQPRDAEANGGGLKRAGVAYVGQKGEIIVLPDKQENSGKKNEDSSEEEKGRSPKSSKKKAKKTARESSEKSRIELEVAKEIKEKERQIEMERQRQLTMEREFQRLRDLDTQERIQRLQSESMKDQISFMQQQRAQFEINNNVHGLASSLSPQTYPRYFANGSIGLGAQGYMGGPMMGSTLLPMSLPTQYAAHSAPLVGSGGVLNGPVVPPMSSQELGRIGDYMRRMGVAPPANQQQWAVLLSTLSFNPSGIPAFDQKSSMYGMGTGPNLSHILGGGVKTLDSTTSDASGQLVSYQPGHAPFRPLNNYAASGSILDVTTTDLSLQPPSTSAVSPVPVSPNTQDPAPVSNSPVKSPTLSSKVYGPLGYKPISFQNHAT